MTSRSDTATTLRVLFTGAPLAQFALGSQLRMNPVHSVNAANNIVSDELQQKLVHLRRARRAANEVAELPLDRREGRFDVAALVVSLEKLRAIEREEVKHSAPRLGLRRADRVVLEGNERLGAVGN